MPGVGIVVHPARPAAEALARKTRIWWEKAGYEVFDLAADASPDQVELAISLGGDGTMLRTVELASPIGAAVLGVNLGQMGYLTEVEPEGIEVAFDRFLSGDYQVTERMTLEVGVLGKERPAGSTNYVAPSYVALNEAVVEKVAPGHTIRIAVEIEGRPFLSYVADGIIVSTPTGSTAYNLSARGPIVSPSLAAMVLTPISPHMLFDRSLVLDPAEWVALRVDSETPAVLAVDGSVSLGLDCGDTVLCRAAAQPARLVTFGQRDFHAILRAKFGLANR